MDAQLGVAASASPSVSNTRITGIDAARGCAMIMVCLSHIKEQFIATAPAIYEALVTVTRIATPTFLLLSGIVIAHVLRTSSRPQVRLALVDRGLFLIFVVHLLLGLDDLLRLSLFDWVFRRGVITDAIGVALLIAVVVRRASAGALIASGVSLMILCWPIATMLTLDEPWQQTVGAMLVHMQTESSATMDVPVLPYVGIFLIGMGLSAWFADLLGGRDIRALSLRLLGIGVASISLVLAGIVVWRTFRDTIVALIGTQEVSDWVRRTFDPRSKLPPSPAYFLFYGGAGLLMTSTMLFLEQRPRARWLVDGFSVFGRASLMCFVVQDWMLRLIPSLLGERSPESVLFWWLYFAVSVAALYWLARKWDAARGNRFLTVGLKALARRWSDRRLLASESTRRVHRDVPT